MIPKVVIDGSGIYKRLAWRLLAGQLIFLDLIFDSSYTHICYEDSDPKDAYMVPVLTILRLASPRMNE